MTPAERALLIAVAEVIHSLIGLLLNSALIGMLTPDVRHVLKAHHARLSDRLQAALNR